MYIDEMKRSLAVATVEESRGPLVLESFPVLQLVGNDQLPARHKNLIRFIISSHIAHNPCINLKLMVAPKDHDNQTGPRVWLL
jgi:hypothetical protein